MNYFTYVFSYMYKEHWIKSSSSVIILQLPILSLNTINSIKTGKTIYQVENTSQWGNPCEVWECHSKLCPEFITERLGIVN